MSVSVVPSSAVAQIEKTILAELDSPPASVPASSAPSTPVDTQLTRDLATLLKDLASGNVAGSISSTAQAQQDLNTPSTTASPLENLLTQIAASLNSTDSTSGSLQNLATYLVQNGEGAGSVVDTSA